MAVHRIEQPDKENNKVDIMLIFSEPLTPEEERILKEGTRLANQQNELWKFFTPASKPASSGNGGDGNGGDVRDEIDFNDLNI